MADDEWFILDALINNDTEKACSVVTNAAPKRTQDFLDYALNLAVQYNNPTLMDTCMRHGHFPILSYNLLKSPGSIDMCTICKFDSLGCLQCVIRHGHDPNQISNPGKVTILKFCMNYKALRCTRWLISDLRVDVTIPLEEPPMQIMLRDPSTTSEFLTVAVELLIDRGIRLSDVIGFIMYYLQPYRKHIDEHLVIKLLKVHNCMPTSDMLSTAVHCQKPLLARYIMDCGIRKIKGSALSTEAGMYIYLIHAFHITNITITPFEHYPIEQCRRALERESQSLRERRLALAMCTHKRLGANCPIQSTIDDALFRHIISLSLQREHLTIN